MTNDTNNKIEKDVASVVEQLLGAIFGPEVMQQQPVYPRYFKPYNKDTKTILGTSVAYLIQEGSRDYILCHLPQEMPTSKLTHDQLITVLPNVAWVPVEKNSKDWEIARAFHARSKVPTPEGVPLFYIPFRRGKDKTLCGKTIDFVSTPSLRLNSGDVTTFMVHVFDHNSEAIKVESKDSLNGLQALCPKVKWVWVDPNNNQHASILAAYNQIKQPIYLVPRLDLHSTGRTKDGHAIEFVVVEKAGTGKRTFGNRFKIYYSNGEAQPYCGSGGMRELNELCPGVRLDEITPDYHRYDYMKWRHAQCGS